METVGLGEPLWQAEDEETSASVVCHYDAPRMLYIVIVSKDSKQKVEYFPAFSEPRSGISEKDFLQAKQIAVKLAESL